MTYDNEHLPPDFLHVCGGVSPDDSIDYLVPTFSPRMWRCFRLCSVDIDVCVIFSTYVEVFLAEEYYQGRAPDFLHVCGGVSEKRLRIWAVLRFSPRMWRCFYA